MPDQDDLQSEMDKLTLGETAPTDKPMPSRQQGGVSTASPTKKLGKTGAFGEQMPEVADTSNFWSNLKAKALGLASDALPQTPNDTLGKWLSRGITAANVIPMAQTGAELGAAAMAPTGPGAVAGAVGGGLLGGAAGLAINKFVNKPENVRLNAGAYGGSLAMNVLGAVPEVGPVARALQVLSGTGKPVIKSVLGRIAARAGLESAGAGLASGSPGAAASTAVGSLLGQGVAQGGAAAAGVVPKGSQAGQEAVQSAAAAGKLPVGAAEQAGNVGRANLMAGTAGFSGAMKARSGAVQQAVTDMIDEAVDNSTRNAINTISRNFYQRRGDTINPETGGTLPRAALDLRDKLAGMFTKRGLPKKTDSFVNELTATPEAAAAANKILTPEEKHTIVGYMIDQARQDAESHLYEGGITRIDGVKFRNGLRQVVEKADPWLTNDQKQAFGELASIVDIADPARPYKATERAAASLPSAARYLGNRAMFHLAFAGTGMAVGGGAASAGAGLALSVPAFLMYKAAMTNPKIGSILVKSASEGRAIAAAEGRQIMSAITESGARLSPDPSEAGSLLALPAQGSFGETLPQ